jgi:hypothetical protein
LAASYIALSEHGGRHMDDAEKELRHAITDEVIAAYKEAITA